MPRTKTTREIVYKFEELDEAGQNEALEQIGTGIMEGFDPDNLTENFKLILEEWGFPTDDIEWSLSHSQGDGVAFYGNIDVRQYLTHTKQLTKYRILLDKDPYVRIIRNSFATHYSHWNTMTVDDETYNLWQASKKAQDAMDELMEDIRDNVVKVSRNLESIGYAEFDWQTSRERIIELIELNEWEFTEHGRIA